MKLGFKLFKQTFTYTFSQVSTYILLFALLFGNLLFVVLVPHIITNQEPWTFALMSNLVSMFTVGFFCAAIAEIIACPEDRLYTLSTPIKRWVYLTIKLIVCILVSCVIAGIISCFHWILDAQDLKNKTMLYVELSEKTLSIFIFCIFGSVFACCFRYYLKNMMPSVIILSIMLIYTVMFILFESQYTGVSEKPKKIKDLFKLQYYLLPLVGFLPLCVITTSAGYILNEFVSIS